LVVNPFNPGAQSTARKILLNIVIGIVVALAGWLIVDAVMAVLYHPSDSTWGTWSSLITSGGIPPCLPQAGSLYQLNEGNGYVGSISGSNPVETTTTGGSTLTLGGSVTYEPDAQAEMGDASPLLSQLIQCMGTKTGFDVTSISDHVITPEHLKTFQECDVGGQSVGCAHTVHSCHYGGVSCVGKSYAVDIAWGTSAQNAAIESAATACGSTWQGPEADHLHVSVGASCGCN
ncbi:MAG: hypothetical protein WAN50_02310, partial [Minisyncoccia bacterium]